jgi:hypothetical protein
MSLAFGSPRARLGTRAVLAVFVGLLLVSALIGNIRPARAVAADLLILSTTITKPAQNGNPLSVEEQEAAALGLTVDVVTPAQWASMTTAQFAAYKAIILGDPTCQVGGTANPFTAAALANKSVWGPAVNGNIAIWGTDPTFHTEFGPFTGPRQVVHSSIDFAAHGAAGKTGAYVSLSCYYNGTTAHTAVPLLDAFETTPGQFTLTGVPGCFNSSHIVATSSALNGLTDASLSNWNCSVHEAFDLWASDFAVLAIALTGTSYTAPDGSVGTPYVLARGNISAGDISLSPPSQTVCTGATATVTAKVTSGGAPLPGKTVTFTITSGPNAGTTFVGTTDASGLVNWSYSGTVAGTDMITASFVDGSGHTQTSKPPVTVIWSTCEQPITATGTTFNATEGQSFTGKVATFTDPNTSAVPTDYTASIDWGDGTSAGTVSGSGGSFTVSGTHTYVEEGTYKVTVTITDVDTPSNTTTATSTAKVADAALTATAACATTSTQAFAGTTATFTDAASPGGTLSDFSAIIDWGDGTTSAGLVVGLNGGPYTVSGTHTYAALGSHTITTTITDVGGAMASATCSTLVFAFASGGSFVVGDQSDTGSVLFWGAQWAKDNSLSGGAAPRSFKGFEDGVATPACRSGWTTDPGNSSGPPDSIPSYMAVIVSSSISKSGSTISGDTVHMVVVKTDPGYAPNPGHPGTGTVVGVIC